SDNISFPGWMGSWAAMTSPSSTPMQTRFEQLPILVVLTVLFALLNYMGSALYLLSAGLTTVKPYSGVGLALILILGRRWLWPVLAAGTLGGMLAKPAFRDNLHDVVLTPSVASLAL